MMALEVHSGRGRSTTDWGGPRRTVEVHRSSYGNREVQGGRGSSSADGRGLRKLVRQQGGPRRTGEIHGGQGGPRQTGEVHGGSYGNREVHGGRERSTEDRGSP